MRVNRIPIARERALLDDDLPALRSGSVEAGEQVVHVGCQSGRMGHFILLRSDDLSKTGCKWSVNVFPRTLVRVIEMSGDRATLSSFYHLDEDSPCRPNVKLFDHVSPGTLTEEAKRVATEVYCFTVYLCSTGFGVGDLEFGPSPVQRVIAIQRFQVG